MSLKKQHLNFQLCHKWLKTFFFHFQISLIQGPHTVIGWHLLNPSHLLKKYAKLHAFGVIHHALCPISYKLVHVWSDLGLILFWKKMWVAVCSSIRKHVMLRMCIFSSWPKHGQCLLFHQFIRSCKTEIL